RLTGTGAAERTLTEPLGTDVGAKDSLLVGDIDADGRLEILVNANLEGVLSFELSPPPGPTATPTPLPTATPTPAPGLTVNGSSSPITVLPGETVVVTVSGGPARPRDWVAKHLST